MCAHSSIGPKLGVPAMSVGETIFETFVVIRDLHVMHLEPYTRYMNRFAMRWKSPVRIVDVVAHIPDAVDHIVTVYFGLVQIPLSKIVFVDSRE